MALCKCQVWGLGWRGPGPGEQWLEVRGDGNAGSLTQTRSFHFEVDILRA